jgi:hypothetical protein
MGDCPSPIPPGPPFGGFPWEGFPSHAPALYGAGGGTAGQVALTVPGVLGSAPVAR